MMTML